MAQNIMLNRMLICQAVTHGLTLLTPDRLHSAQYAALRAVNKELIALYWDIGKLIEERQETEGWGKAVVERLSADLRAEFGEKSGFSGRNLWYMRTFYREYKEQPILQPLAAEIAWTKNTLILVCSCGGSGLMFTQMTCII